MNAQNKNPDPDWLVDDRRWFEENPDRRFRLREYVAGEFTIHDVTDVVEPTDKVEQLSLQADAAALDAEASEPPSGDGSYVVVMRSPAQGPDSRARTHCYLPLDFVRDHDPLDDAMLLPLVRELNEQAGGQIEEITGLELDQ